MSVHEVRLPSPPPETQNRSSMSRLFNRSIRDKKQAEIHSDATESDIESVGRKKVGFHPWTTNILEPQLSTPDSEVAPSLKSLPPSRDCQISSRPILKPTYSTEGAIRPSQNEEKKSHIDMMDSLLSNIEIGDRSVSTDAYQTMISLIKEYDEPPEAEILQAKITKLQSYIKRDLVILDTPSPSNSSEERLGLGNLVSSALKVLVTMVWSSIYSPCLSDDFCLWAVDRAITVLKEHAAPKAILLHYMHLIATQNFRFTIFTNSNGARTTRILEALQNLTDHVSGKAVIAERVLVYEKLMTQAKQTMEKKADLWLKNLITAMGHSFKEVRKNALSAGTRACNVFPDSLAIATAARQALAEDTGERTISASVTNKLEKLVAAKEDVNQIPQLWTIVLILCNNGRVKLDSWSQVQLHEWLKLIQRCFNSSDTAVHIQALMAWNRLYYVARPHEASDKIISMLAKPAMKKLDAIGPAQSNKGTRQAVMSSYCMLLYYAFRPSLTHPQITRMWNEFVVKNITSSFLSRNNANCDLSCRVLSALFYGNSTSRIWNERRAQENTYLDPQELPAIDNKWIRSHATSVLAVLKVVVNHSSFGPDGTVSEQAYAAQCWRNFNKAIRESSSKEVVPSAETRAAQQSIVDFLELQSLSSESAQKHEAIIDLLANITVQEFSVPSLMQALESSAQTQVTIVLQAVIHAICQSLQKEESVELNQRVLHKSLKILKQSLEQTMKESTDNVARGVRITSTILKSISTTKELALLEQIQSVWIELLQKSSDDATNENGELWDDTPYMLLASTSIALLESVDTTESKNLKGVLDALSSSSIPQIKQKALALQAAKMPRSKKPSPCTTVMVNIPPVTEDTVSPSGSMVSSTKGKSRSKNAFLNRLKQNATERRPRHDDSQVEFVSINSSPPQSVQFDSQLLTARQKEVRSRQEKESAITFADIRSSPAHTVKKSMQDPGLPSTPPLPQQQLEDDSQTPTPTPKARKIMQATLQPEIPSSPPSESGGDNRGCTTMAITSSPIKETAPESEDALQLSISAQDEIPETAQSEPQSHVSHSWQRGQNTKGDYFGTAAAHRTVEGTHSPNRNTLSTNENFETAPATSSSPISYSDEDDARAASQLSQSLLHESGSVSAQPESSDVETSTRKKRKRAEEDTTHNIKKRKIPEQNKEQDSNQDEMHDDNNQDAELSDCIVVNTSFSRPLNWRSAKPSKKSKSKNRNMTDSPASSQHSQRSSTGTPASQKSSGTRRRRSRGSARLSRSQSSQVDENEATQLLSSEPLDTEGDLEDTLPLDPYEIPPSETIEVEHVEKPKSPSPIPQQVKKIHIQGKTDTPDVRMQEPSTEITNPAPLRSSHYDTVASNQPFDAARSLQSILDTMNAQAGGQELDLATIHSLCFRIGLKAQQLARQD